MSSARTWRCGGWTARPRGLRPARGGAHGDRRPGRGRAGPEHFGDLRNRSVAGVSAGNNGGAVSLWPRVFHGWGARVRVFLLADRQRVGGDARINLDVALKMGLELVEIPDESRLDRLDLAGADLVVDAIFGTGLGSEVRGLQREAIEAVNRSGLPVAAVDIPSGVDSDTGQIRCAGGEGRPDRHFGLPKTGLCCPPGEVLAGRLRWWTSASRPMSWRGRSRQGTAAGKRVGRPPAPPGPGHAQGTLRPCAGRGRLHRQNRATRPGRHGGGPDRGRTGHPAVPASLNPILKPRSRKP